MTLCAQNKVFLHCAIHCSVPVANAACKIGVTVLAENHGLDHPFRED